MGVKYKVDSNFIPEIKANMKSMKARTVTIGALEGESAWLAGIHEYGCTIRVTPKMRAYLHGQGLHLKDSTTVIKIPERSFLRSTFDSENDRIMKQTERAIGQVVSGAMSVDDMLDLCGQQFATAIKGKIVEISSPPNHPYTVEQKGSSNPLVDTGGLVESITWKVE